MLPGWIKMSTLLAIISVSPLYFLYTILDSILDPVFEILNFFPSDFLPYLEIPGRLSAASARVPEYGLQVPDF